MADAQGTKVRGCLLASALAATVSDTAVPAFALAASASALATSASAAVLFHERDLDL